MAPTIKLGSTGEYVKKWQAIVGQSQTGTFDNETRSRTINYQKKAGLAADGIVGPMTWSHALRLKAPISIPKPDSIDAKAYAIAKRAAPSMSEKELQYVLTVGKGEGRYGLGWGNPSEKTILKSQQFGLTGYEGQGSNNWGAVQGKTSAGSFPHIDHHADGSVYVGQYKRYATPEEGFLDMARIILSGGKRKEVGKQEIKSALSKGSLKDAVYAQWRNGYFELAPDKYLAGVVQNYEKLTANIGWPKKLSVRGSLLSRIPVAIMVIVSGGAAWYFLRK